MKFANDREIKIGDEAVGLALAPNRIVTGRVVGLDPERSDSGTPEQIRLRIVVFTPPDAEPGTARVETSVAIGLPKNFLHADDAAPAAAKAPPPAVAVAPGPRDEPAPVAASTT